MVDLSAEDSLSINCICGVYAPGIEQGGWKALRVIVTLVLPWTDSSAYVSIAEITVIEGLESLALSVGAYTIGWVLQQSPHCVGSEEVVLSVDVDLRCDVVGEIAICFSIG